MFEDDSEDEESSLDQLEQFEPPSEAEGKVGPLEVTFSYYHLHKFTAGDDSFRLQDNYYVSK